ncbi:hypothetical protein BLNAU_4256 [Blattamonas nauphoetae]|uniref:Uncharacterized protein n=1 Tax=Blattamonas nauphoetae TaxID=2049346 RepID=A0ABQ9YB71_9EUKA|nr:hypothetical protein BLNAU_4256 [Blattamonas nauphoetae]
MNVFDLVSSALDKFNTLPSHVQEGESTTQSGLIMPKDETILELFDTFKTAYNAIPSEVRSPSETSYLSFVRLWSTSAPNFESKAYHLKHDDLRDDLTSMKTKSALEIQRELETNREIFRNLQISIDSSIIPLHQTEIPNFEEEAECGKPFNKAKYMFKKHRPVVRMTRDTFCYTYDVIMCQPSSQNEVYDPAQAFSSQSYLGEVTMPSIHHFPHFFKLFVNQDNKVENRLRGTTWHIVDDFVLHSRNLPDGEHVVLLTSPNKKRWNNITAPKAILDPVFLYNVPTLLFPEMIHVFNAIPCPYEYDPKPTSLMMRAQNIIPLQGMIPRDVFTPYLLNCGYRNIHPSSPQFDPLNWFTQHATLDASQIVHIRTTKTMNESTKPHLISPYNELLDGAEFDKGQNEVFLSAVEDGLTLTQFRPIGSRTINSPTVSFPKTNISLIQVMNDSSTILTITMPDAVSLRRHEAEAYNPQWDLLFQCCLRKEALTGFSHPRNVDNTLDTDEDFVNGGRRAHWARLQVVTSHLVANNVQNGEFDSILLVFRLLKESDVLHSLGVFFLKNTTEWKFEFTDEGVQLMKKWCFILKTLYRLKRVQIFPSFIVVADLNKCPNFKPKMIQKLRSFIAGQNILVAQFETKRGIDVEDVSIPAMTASTAPVLARFTDLEVNHSPQAVRCAFCGSLVAENFPDHYCQAMWNNRPRIRQNFKLIDLVYSDQQRLVPVEEHVEIERRSKGRLFFKSTEIVFEETQVSAGKTEQTDESQNAKTVEIFGDILSIESDIEQKKVRSGLWPTLRSTSNRTDFVRITCTSEIPGTPDCYRFPFPPLPSAMMRTITPNDVIRHRASTHQSSDSPNDPSRIVEAHSLWSDGFKLSCEKLSRSQYKVIKLSEQPYHSLEFDVPSVDITNHKHNAQLMLPAGTNVRFGRIPVRQAQVTDPLRDKRIEYESFWQSLNRKNPSAGLSDALQADQTEMEERIQTCESETEKSHLACFLAKCLLLRSRLSLQSGDLITAMSLFGQSKHQMVLNDAAEVECELIERIQDCENVIMKTHPTCLEAKELLLRSRLSLQSGEIELAISLFEKSQEHIEMNDAAVVEFESKHTHSSGPETNSHQFDELERVAANARECFGINWERWIREGQDLPIILNPSFHILQHHLQQVQDHVDTLGSCLESFVVEIPSKEEPFQDTPGSASTDVKQTNEARRTMVVNTLLHALKDGLSLQLRIAWETGSWDEVHFFQNELKSISRIFRDASGPRLPATFKSQTEQIEELDIDVVTRAIGNILNRTRDHCNTWHALVREHRHSHSPTPRPPGNLEGTRTTNKVRMIVEGNPSISGPLPQHASVPHDIRMNAQLLIDRISGIIAACYWKLEKTGNNEMMNDLYEMITELSTLVSTNSDCDGNVETVASRSSDVMLIDESAEKTNLRDVGDLKIDGKPFGKQRRKKTKETDLNCGKTPSAAEIDGKHFGKQKRGDQTDSGEFDAPSKAEKRMWISIPPN